jgi:hypothetical protein
MGGRARRNSCRRNSKRYWKTLEEVLEGEKTKPLTGRLEVQFDAPKQKVLGEEATHQR